MSLFERFQFMPKALTTSKVFPPLISCCSRIWFAHVPLLQQHRRATFEEFDLHLPSDTFCVEVKTSWEHIQRLKWTDSQPQLPQPPRDFHWTCLFYSPPRLSSAWTRGASSRGSLTVCFCLLSTSGQHLTSEQIRIHNPDSAEAGAEAQHRIRESSLSLKITSKRHGVSGENIWR